MKREQSFAGFQNFDDILLKAVDEGLETLGESSKTIIYFHLQNKYALRREDIPRKPECFGLAIRCLLGMSGSFIETLVIKNLCAKFGLEYESLKNYQFQAAVEEIKQIVNNKSSIA
jgi:hypothetical protein